MVLAPGVTQSFIRRYLQIVHLSQKVNQTHLKTIIIVKLTLMLMVSLKGNRLR